MKKIPLRWALIAGVVYVVLIVTLSGIFILPQNLKIKELKAKIQSGEGVAGKEEETEKALSLRRELETTYERLSKKVLPSDNFVLTKIFELAGKARIRILLVNPVEETGKGELLQVLLVGMTLSGDYRQIVDFIHLLETDHLAFRVTKINLKNEENHLQAEIGIATLKRKSL